MISRFSKLKNYCLFACFLVFCHGKLSAQKEHEKEPFTVEGYYKIRWGHVDEFINLWKKNHYPMEKQAMANGDILSITAEKPRLHSGEDTRWDLKVTIVYKNSLAAFDHELTTPYKKQLYPNQEQLAKDEKQRWDLVLAHWDVMTEAVELK